MKEYVLERRTWIGRPLAEVFEFFSAAENLARITPPALAFRIRSALPIEMRVGAVIEYTIRPFGLPVRWQTEITRWEPPHAFQDRQRAGPYAKWVHTHTFRPEDGGTAMEDRVVYALPLGVLGRIGHPLVRRKLGEIFDFREAMLHRLFS